MYRPRSIGYEQNAGDFNMALVMGEIVSKPGAWTQLSIGRQIKASQPTVSRSIVGLEARDWVVRGQLVPRIGSGRTARLLSPTDEFDEAVKRAATAALSLDPPLDELYTHTVDAARNSRTETEDLAAYESRARFLGGVAVLGEHADLQEMTDGEWLPYHAGWQLLVTAQSVRPEQA